MKNRDRIVLEKILAEIAVADNLMGQIDLKGFLADEKLKRAISMTIINIGELVKNLDDDFRSEHPQIPWKAIAGFRDVAAHKYQALHMEDVYTTARVDLPALQTELSALL